VSSPDRRPPPVGEEIHLPGPTLLPFISAIAITLIVIGTTLGIGLSILGLIILVVCIVRWVGDTRRDVSELPEDH
jgi:Flp pilus assembly protein TadB